MTKLVKIQLAMAVPLLIAGGFFAFYIYYQVYKNIGVDYSPNNNEIKQTIYSKIDGTKIDNENITIVGVMIENHVDARPQSGLSKARIVYEVLAESDITRFLAVYDLSDNLEKIGPVRSARPYYIDLASEYKALYAHSGGSPKALSRLKTDTLVYNLDEFFGYNSGYFWRDNKRYAPHNLYTSSELLIKAKDHYDISNYNDLTSWKFKDGNQSSVNDYEIKINYSEADVSKVIWKYLKDNNKYERWQNNNRHLDDDGSIIESDNVIVQYSKTTVLDEIGRKDIKLVGTGKAIIFRDGLAITGSWERKDINSRTFFYDDNKNEIEFNRGKIWIEIVPTDLEIIY